MLRYTVDGGRTWVNIQIPEGSYDLKDINESIIFQMRHRSHFDRTNNHMYGTLSSNDSTLRSVLERTNPQYKIDFNIEKSIRTVRFFHKQTKIYIKRWICNIF